MALNDRAAESQSEYASVGFDVAERVGVTRLTHMGVIADLDENAFSEQTG